MCVQKTDWNVGSSLTDAPLDSVRVTSWCSGERHIVGGAHETGGGLGDIGGWRETEISRGKVLWHFPESSRRQCEQQEPALTSEALGRAITTTSMKFRGLCLNCHNRPYWIQFMYPIANFTINICAFACARRHNRLGLLVPVNSRSYIVPIKLAMHTQLSVQVMLMYNALANTFATELQNSRIYAPRSVMGD